MAVAGASDGGAGAAVRLGDQLPDCAITTDQGTSSLLSFDPSNWLLLFSYPKDMTPVCATEMAELAKCHEEFSRRGVSLLGLCVGTVEEHRAFVQDVEETFEVSIRFPVIADVSREVVRSLGLIHPRMRGTAGGRHSVRSVIVASPVEPDAAGREVELLLHYPPHIGRDTTELLRCVDALLRSHADGDIGTPANWRAGDDVLLLPTATEEEVDEKQAARATAAATAGPGGDATAGAPAAPSGFSQLRSYLRLKPDPGISLRDDL
ncbi:hypothetical protein FNF27_07371 [Cafeteria roenbergensis]|uniref:Thioredoxin domain-containing protein n=2 Tax=Cafeteria roenbergensis TaxID=33653 RepID=A0A5A8DPS3_CAFRO|nr:hypothetical protein FNF27_07371 [Cafeteria roenbergensis]